MRSMTPIFRILLTAIIIAMVPVFSLAAEDSAPTSRPVDRAELEKLLPDVSTVKVYDRPSDEGDTITVEWAATVAKDDAIVSSVSYIVEIAKKREDFGTEEARTVTIKPGAAALKSANKKYYGFSKKNESIYIAEIVPSSGKDPNILFPPSDPKPEELARELLSESEFERYEQIRKITKPEDQLSDQERADKEWFKFVDAWLSNEKSNYLKGKSREIDSKKYFFRLGVQSANEKVYVSRNGDPVVFECDGARANFFAWYKLNNLIYSLLFSIIVMAFIQIARRNPNLYIRRIPGLEAVEEAIGRATEMGRGIFYIPGIEYLEHRATIASMNILSRVAKRAADYDTRIQVMNMDPVVTAVSQEVVQQAYTEAGRPDAFDPDDVTLSAFDQFSYVAAVAGRIVREQPAAIFLMGHFYAESLLLAETGASTGAIQVAGTDAFTQLPFFVTTCDYTLIGEELFAASAYLSREPKLLGSLRGQDIGKAFLMITMIVGALLMTIGLALDWHLGWVEWIVTSFS